MSPCCKGSNGIAMEVSANVDIIERNNHAVDFMVEGRYSAAYAILRECFSAARTAAIDQKASQAPNNAATSLSARHHVLKNENQNARLAQEFTSHSHPPPSWLLVPAELHPFYDDHDEDFFVFRQPIYLDRVLKDCMLQSSNYSCVDKDAVFNHVVVGAVITFNLALLFQLSAERNYVESLVIKAQQLYLSVVGLMQELPMSLHTFAIDLAIVALNNLIRVSVDLGDESQATESHTTLLQLCLMRGSAHIQEDESSRRQLFLSELDDSVLHEIQTNIIVFRGPDDGQTVVNAGAQARTRPMSCCAAPAA